MAQIVLYRDNPCFDLENSIVEINLRSIKRRMEVISKRRESWFKRIFKKEKSLRNPEKDMSRIEFTAYQKAENGSLCFCFPHEYHKHFSMIDRMSGIFAESNECWRFNAEIKTKRTVRDFDLEERLESFQKNQALDTEVRFKETGIRDGKYIIKCGVGDTSDQRRDYIHELLVEKYPGTLEAERLLYNDWQQYSKSILELFNILEKNNPRWQEFIIALSLTITPPIPHIFTYKIKEDEIRGNLLIVNNLSFQIKDKATLIKIGGSMYDTTEDKESNGADFNGLLKTCADIHTSGKRIILTVGLGRKGDPIKDDLSQDRLTDETYDKQVPIALSSNAEMVQDYLKQLDVKAQYSKAHSGITAEYLDEKVAIICEAPEFMKLNPRDSDAHTLGIAELYGIKTVAFAKDTEGIYLKDPKIDENRESNPLLKTILASELLAGEVDGRTIERKGTDGRNEHLIEDSALRFLLEKCKFVERIHIVDGKNPEAIKYAISGEFDGEPLHGSIIYRDKSVLPKIKQ